jgi:hypothetical protein
VSDELIFSGGGSVAVGSGALIDARDRLAEAQRELLHLEAAIVATRLRMPPGSLVVADAPASAFGAQTALADTAVPIAFAAGQAGLLAGALNTAMIGYGLAEQAAELAIKALAARLGFELGWLPVLGGLVLAPVGGWAAAAVGGAIVGAGGLEKFGDGFSNWLAENNRALNDPVTVKLVKTIVDTIDDVMAGAAHLPASLAFFLDKAGILSVGSAAAAIVAGAGVTGGFTQTRIAVTRTNTVTTRTTPDGFRDRLDRIPQASEEDGAQIRIDRYSVPGKPDVYEVYISGTQEWSPWNTDSPFDLGSNVRGVADLPNGSLEAVKKAMAQAGVDENSKVVFVGHSQGGLIAHELAASGEYNTTAVIEAGPPASGSRIDSKVPELILAHDSDIVTGLGGSYTNDDAIIVSRDPYSTEPIPPGDAFQSHSREVYKETAELLDQAGTDRTDGVRDKINGLIEGATSVESSYYRAKRMR